MGQTRLGSIAGYFTRLGFTGFGGPLAHVAMMEEYAVQRRGWLTSRQFSSALALCQILPGPVSTQLAIHIGYLRSGLPGALTAGAGFILPAFFMMLGLSHLYWRFGSLPQVALLLYGLKPAVIGLIALAALRLGRVSARSGAAAACVAVAFLARTLLGLDEVMILLGLGALGALLPGLFPRSPAAVGADASAAELARSERDGAPPQGGASSRSLASLAAIGLRAGLPSAKNAAVNTAAVTTGSLLAVMALFFLKAGAFMFGGGYVIVPLMETYAVDQAGLMGRSEFLDGIALGQVTPGPIMITATFVGYRAAGVTGALVATVAAFLPSFAWILAVAPHLPRLGRGRRASAFLAAANPAAVGTIAAAAVSLGRTCLVDSVTAVIATAVLALALRRRVTPFFLLLGAAVAGVILR